MRIVTEVRHEETFTFTPDGEPPVTIRSGKLREWLLANAMHKVIEITFPEQTLDEIVQQHGLEQPRLDSMTLLANLLSWACGQAEPMSSSMGATAATFGPSRASQN